MTRSDDVHYSVVIPFFNEGNAVQGILDEIDVSFFNVGNVQIVAIDDGSADSTWSELESWEPKRSVIDFLAIRFLKNEGQNLALCSGVMESCASVVVTMDGDGQHPAEVAKEMARMVNDALPAVQAIRQRSTGRLKSSLSNLFYAIVRALGGISVPAGASEFRAVDGDIYRSIARSYAGQALLRVAFFKAIPNAYCVPFIVPPRSFGRSKYSISKQLTLAKRSFPIFSEVLGSMGAYLALIGAILGLFFGGYALFVRAVTPTAVAGWASVSVMLSLVLFLVSILFLQVGNTIQLIKPLAPLGGSGPLIRGKIRKIRS